MNPTLLVLHTQLTQLAEFVKATVPQDKPFSIAHGGWNFPGLTGQELFAEAQELIDLIEDNGTDAPLSNEETLLDYVRRIEYMRTNTVSNIWGNPAAGVTVYLQTLQGLRKVLAAELLHDDKAATVTALRKLSTQIRSMEVRMRELEPRTGSLAAMVKRIEDAHDAADQLPTDMASLAEARQTLEKLLNDAIRDHGMLVGIRKEATEAGLSVQACEKEANAVLERCEAALRASTNVGLAAAFQERSRALANSMWTWVAGLVAALAVGSFFGSTQLQSLATLSQQPDLPVGTVILNLLLSLLSVGAPIWFGWLATKQIGQRFRLAEDYAFKASISRAYEGYRKEASRVDSALEARLLSSALTRLDELPLRLVESDTHGSPWHELASSDLVKEAMRAVPGFSGQVKDLATNAINAMKPSKAKQPAEAPPTPIAAPPDAA